MNNKALIIIIIVFVAICLFMGFTESAANEQEEKIVASIVVEEINCDLARDHEAEMGKLSYYTAERYGEYVKFCIKHEECDCIEME